MSRKEKTVLPSQQGKFEHKGVPFNIYVYEHDGHVAVRANVYGSVASAIKAYKNKLHDDDDAMATVVVFYEDTSLCSDVVEQARRDVAESVEEYASK